MSESTYLRFSDDEREMLTSEEIQEREEAILQIFGRLSDDEEALLFSRFVTGIRETFEGGVDGTDVEFTSECEGRLCASFLSATFMGCKDIDGENMYDEPVSFYIDFEQGEVFFETDPPPPPEDREDEI